MLRLPKELIVKVLLNTEDRNTLNLLHSCREMYQMCEDRGFWHEKLTREWWLRPQEKELTAQQLRRRYTSLVRCVESVGVGHVPTADSKDLGTRYTRVCIEAGLVLLYHDIDQGVMAIEYVGGSISHTERRFVPHSVYSNDEYCLGWESGRFVILQVVDWAQVKVLDDDDWRSAGRYLIRVCFEGNNAGTIELWNSTKEELLNSLIHTGLNDVVVNDVTSQLISVSSKHGNVKVWNLDTAECQYAFEVPNVDSVYELHGDIICFGTRTQEFELPLVFCHLNGLPVPWLLEKWHEASYWAHFADGDHVIGTSENVYPQMVCNFTIIGSDGKVTGEFRHDNVITISTFIERFAVTAARGGAMKIWSKYGNCLVDVYLGYGDYRLFEDLEGRLFAAWVGEHSLREFTMWNFGAI